MEKQEKEIIILAEYLDFMIELDRLMSSTQIGKAYSRILDKKMEVSKRLAILTK